MAPTDSIDAARHANDRDTPMALLSLSRESGDADDEAL